MMPPEGGLAIRMRFHLFVCALAAGCGGSGVDKTVAPLPAGSGVFFTESEAILSGNALFWRVDEFTGDTISSGFPQGGVSCPWLSAMDAGTDGVVIGVGGENAEAYRVDPRSPSKCVKEGDLPAVMQAVAVRADGEVFCVSKSPVALYELDAGLNTIRSSPVVCTGVPGACTIAGADFAPDGRLFAITEDSTWGVLDTAGGFTGIGGIGLRDDFDIDAGGNVRALTGDELRVFDLSGAQRSAVNVYGGTLFATGVVYR
jgi:hypothetical protein